MHGIIQPLVLRRIGEKFEIIAGERRYKASVMAGLTTVPAVIMNIDDQKSAEVAIVENLQRKNLTAIEEAQSYKKLLDKGYLTQEELANKLGISTRQYQRLEAGTSDGSIKTWLKLKDILNAETIDYLLEQEVDDTNLTNKE